MTSLSQPLSLSRVAAEAASALADAAAAAARTLPAAAPLSAEEPCAGTASSATGFGGAAIAEMQGPVTGAMAVLVGTDLVEALAASPLGALDLAGATQPAMDAVARALGGRIGAARTVPVDLVVNDLGEPFTLIPLTGSGASAALLVNDAVLESVAARAAAAAPPRTSPSTGLRAARGLEMLQGVVMDVTVEVGRTRMSVRELLALTPGTVLELDRAAGSPADLLVNGRLIARGEVVVVDEDFGLRVTEIVDDSSGG